ncbi:hypothetical protein, partial [Paraburkholderia sp. UYCP14C]|uniref:hypothetical protein n=1 Tax=Paraburkholderia sp. UYCP14C TaxID=2511130 RepID=UPI001B7D6EE0
MPALSQTRNTTIRPYLLKTLPNKVHPVDVGTHETLAQSVRVHIQPVVRQQQTGGTGRRQ